jgi:uncharacterized protein DUF7010
MLVSDAQREVRLTYMGGFPGSVVSGTMWLASAALGTWDSTRNAILMLVVGGPFIFPLTQLLLKAMGRRATLQPANPLAGLAMQIAFTIPLSLPLIGAATIHRLDWFYPAFLIVVGAHYLPFIFLYGMWTFALLAAAMIGGGTWIGITMSGPFTYGGWFGGAVILMYGVLGLILTGREQRQEAPAAR